MLKITNSLILKIAYLIFVGTLIIYYDNYDLLGLLLLIPFIRIKEQKTIDLETALNKDNTELEHLTIKIDTLIKIMTKNNDK